MGACGAAHCAGQARRQSASCRRARSRQRPDVYPEHRVSVAGDRQGPAAALDALRLFRPVGLGRHARSHPRRALCAVPPSRCARGEPDRGDHRQPERQERGKRGPAIDPTGYDAGKKITRSSCLAAPRSRTRSRTSGSISARTGSQTPSSKTTTQSSTPHAPLGENSSLNPKRSPPSECATGTSVSRYDS